MQIWKFANIFVLWCSAFISQFKVYWCTYATYGVLYCAVVEQHIITTTIIFSCHSNFFSINDATLFKVVPYNIALFYAALFDFECLKLHYLKFHYFNVALFNVAQFDVALFQCCIICFIFLLFFVSLDVVALTSCCYTN